MTYGNFCGTAPSVLLAQRRAVAPAAAPASGTVGQNINMAFILADGSPKGKVDPAFPAHAGPIVYMAKAVWHGWLSNQAMLSGTATALLKQTKAIRPWLTVNGPFGGFVASATRLGWIIHDAFSCTTEQGRTVYFKLDPLRSSVT